jgi:type III secretory pathway component EscS
MFIPGFLISIVTFPCVIVHELAHQLFCRLYKIPVFEVVYFRVQSPNGYVLHETAQTKWQSIMISVGPFIVNTLIGALISLPAALPVFKFHTATPLDYLLIYLGVSIAMHAFPSTGDANSIWETVSEEETSFWVKLVAYPIVGLIYIGSIGSFFWLDALYGVAVAVGLPNLIIWMFA